jgi:pyruvate/2-oxoglutarate dehydrogenase complex dihydrolipoamide acyltransferase (E2) component
MSYSNVVGGKLQLKGKALDVKGGLKKKKRKRESHQQQLMLLKAAGKEGNKDAEGASHGTLEEESREGVAAEEEEQERESQLAAREDHRTPAEKKYHEQKEKLELRRLAKVASKSHRQRVEEFNQYLANLSEHYDIPKVGPG